MSNNSISLDENLKVLSVLPVLGHITDSKRISMLQKFGFSVQVVAFQRDHHSARFPNCPIKVLGKISNGQYFRRIIKLAIAIPEIRRSIRKNHFVYASGVDMALSAIIAGVGLNRPVIMEVSDLRKVQVSKGLLGSLVRRIDRFVVNRCKLLVVTASGFVDGYYRKQLNTNTQALVLENKLEALDPKHVLAPKLLEGLPFKDRPLVIGYFGVLRCEWSFQVLETLALSHPTDVKIVIAGHLLEPKDLIERAEKLANVEFLGEYSSPGDLPSLYGKVDIVWACYPPPDTIDLDWRWAQMICRSNRFYESCFFKKPIISVSGSGDADEVERYGIGLVVKDQSIDSMVETITSIKEADLTSWRENITMLPNNIYEYTNEDKELGDALKNIIMKYSN